MKKVITAGYVTYSDLCDTAKGDHRFQLPQFCVEVFGSPWQKLGNQSLFTFADFVSIENSSAGDKGPRRSKGLKALRVSKMTPADFTCGAPSRIREKEQRVLI